MGTGMRNTDHLAGEVKPWVVPAGYHVTTQERRTPFFSGCAHAPRRPPVIDSACLHQVVWGGVSPHTT